MRSYEIKGVIKDYYTGNPVNNAKVILVDENGSVVNGIGTSTFDDGRFSLKIPMKSIKNPMNEMIPLLIPSSDRILVRGGIKGEYEPKTIKLNLKEGKKNYTIKLKDKIDSFQEEDEFTIVAVSSKTKCEKMGGAYDEKRRVCMLPQSKRKSNRWLVIGGIAILVVAIGVISHKMIKNGK